MAIHSHSDTKPLTKPGSIFADAYPDSLLEIFAILVARFENRKNESDSSEKQPEEGLLPDLIAEASSLLTTHGGTVIQSSDGALQAYYHIGKNAVKAAIALRHALGIYNASKNLQSPFHVKIGVDYGEIIRDTDNLQGNTVENAHLLSDIASPDEICVSWPVFNLSKDLPAVYFEMVHPWNRKKIPEGFEIYRIVWKPTQKTSCLYCVILCFRPIWKLWDQTFADIWEDLISNGQTLWGGHSDQKEILDDRSIVLILKSMESILPLSMAVSKFLRKRIQNSTTSLIPIQIIADIGPYGENWQARTNGLPPLWEKLNPGYLYISEQTYASLQQKIEIPGNAIHRTYSGQSFYQVGLDNELPSQETKRFLYQKALVQGDLLPCFYCGDRKHHPTKCPSKNIPETTGALNQLGYCSIDELNDIFYHHIIGENGPGVNPQVEDSLSLPASGFFELKRVFQLRFFRSFWNTTNEEWNNIRKSRNKSEGGLIWLAQDSLRVSELTKAESMLVSAMNKYPLDYRVYVASGFLDIEKDDLSRAEHDFSEAYAIAKTNVQKAFTLLLLSRLYWITGNLDKAYEKVQRIYSLNVDSVDAMYQDVLLKLFQGKEKLACQRLSRLVQEDREFFVAAMIDPDLAPYSGIVGDTLEIILNRARQDAQSAVSDADNEYELSKVVLGKSDLNDIQILQTKIEQLLNKDSYCGYLDIIDHCNSIITTCRKRTIHRRREIWGILRELNKRLETNMMFVESYPYKSMVRSCRQQLVHSSEKIRHVQSIGPALSQEQLAACHNLYEELTKEWDSLESKLRGLNCFLQFCKASLHFLRWSGTFMAITWFLGLFLFPLIIYYLNAFLSGFATLTFSNVWFYQKNCVLFGSLAGIGVALAITIKSLFKK